MLCACSGAEESRESPAESTPSAESAPAAAVGSSPGVAPGSAPGTPSDGTPPTTTVGSLPRVVTLGTSLTAGYGLPDPTVESWPARLEARAAEAGTPVRVVNAGVSGDTSAGGLRRIDWILREPVDLLIVELGANDGLRGLPVDALEANLDSIVVRTLRRWPEAHIALVPMEAPPNLGPAYVEEFRDAFREVAARHGVRLLPFILDGIAGIPDLNQSDGIHPTVEGHHRMVDNLWAALAPLLDSLTAAGDAA